METTKKNIMRFNYWQTFYEERFYHIYNRAIGRDNLFVEAGNYRFFLSKWQQYIHPYVDTYAYCLMGNHFHFLIRVKQFDNVLKESLNLEKTVAARQFLAQEGDFNVFLTDQFKRLFSAYTLAFNKQQQRHGSLFQEAFKRIQIDNDVKLLNTLCYVHHNPIHHDMSPFYDFWQYSSYNTYLSDKSTLLARQNGLALFGDKMGAVKDFLHYHELYKKEKRALKKGLEWDDDLMVI
jgi:REP element-mobilizing transposase RayT